MLGIGIDTGGTCTDAVIYDYDTGKVLGSGKAPTTKQNLEIGIANALDTLPPELVAQAGNIALSTTLATNACLENKGARAKLLLIGFNESLMDGLKDRRKLLPQVCQYCSWLPLCNGNFRSRAEAVSGDFWGFDPACYLTEKERSLTLPIPERKTDH